VGVFAMATWVVVGADSQPATAATCVYGHDVRCRRLAAPSGLRGAAVSGAVANPKGSTSQVVGIDRNAQVRRMWPMR